METAIMDGANEGGILLERGIFVNEIVEFMY
jgi:hypothetical protein